MHKPRSVLTRCPAAILNVALHGKPLMPMQVAVLLYVKTGGQVERYFTSR